jgi:hypothetical protein
LNAGSIIDGNTDAVDITAASLRIETATGSVGLTDDRLETTIDTLIATVAAGDVFINETDTLSIDTVADISVNRMGSDGFIDEANSPTDTSLSGITASGNVDIKAELGDIQINHIIAQENVVIHAVAGSILDHANDDVADITAGDSKTITLTASADIKGTGADIYLELYDGALLTAQSTTKGNIHIQGKGDITLQDIQTTDGSIHVLAQNDISS